MFFFLKKGACAPPSLHLWAFIFRYRWYRKGLIKMWIKKITLYVKLKKACWFHYIFFIKIYQFDESFLIKENISLWGVFSSRMKNHYLLKIWWTFIYVIKFHQYDENSSLWWKCITVKKIQHCDEDLSLWWKYITLMKIYHSDEN